MPELEKIRGMGGGRGVIIFALMELEGGEGVPHPPLKRKKSAK